MMRRPQENRSTAATRIGPAFDHTAAAGWINGFIGVLNFCASLPATRVAALDLDPLFVTFARAHIAQPASCWEWPPG
jgi:hypothetical protein